MFIVVTATVNIERFHGVLCGVYCGYSNSEYRSILLFFVEFLVVIALVNIMQYYSVV